MKRIALSFVVLIVCGLQALAQNEPDPPVIAMMEKLGTVYVTRRPAKSAKKADSEKKAKSIIIGVDFRPTMDSDPKKVAAAVKELASLPELEFVLLLGRDITDEAADSLPPSAKLVRVQLFNTKVTDKGVASLTRLKNLRVFNYTGMGLTDVGLKELAKIKTLQTIIVTDAKITDEGVMSLQNLTSLRVLTVENTLATEKGIERLREKLPNLRDFERTLR